MIYLSVSVGGKPRCGYIQVGGNNTNLPAFGCTGEATVNYRAPERLMDMFKEGNEVMKKSYETLPWRKK